MKRTGIDKSDDELSNVIAWSSFSCENLYTRNDLLSLSGRHLLESQVAVNASKRIHELTLVLVDTLDLDGEERVGVDWNIESSLNVLCQSDLVLVLDVVKSLDEGSVINFSLNLAEQCRISKPGITTEGLGDQLC